MRNLYEVAEICCNEVSRCGIDTGIIFQFKTNPRLRTTWGICRPWRGAFIIEVHPFLLDDRTPEKVLKNTLIHEILHTCPGCQNHGRLWKSYADRVNRLYGYEITTYISENEIKEVADAGTYSRDSTARYIMQCDGCKRRARYQRMTEFVRNPVGKRCRYCGCKTFTRIK